MDINNENTQVINRFSIENGHLFADMVDAVDTQQIESAEIENGHLFVKGVNSMAKVDLGQVVGAKGDKGDAGAAATITIGTVTTGAAGSSAAVTNSGTASAAVLNFKIPKGDTGATPSLEKVVQLV